MTEEGVQELIAERDELKTQLQKAEAQMANLKATIQKLNGDMDVLRKDVTIHRARANEALAEAASLIKENK